MKRTLEDLRDIGVITGTIVALGATLVIGLPAVLFKEEVIDRITGEKKRRDEELQASSKRSEEEVGRVQARRNAYVNWGMNVKPIIQENYFSTREQIKQFTGREIVPQRWGASFWDYGYRELKAVEREDGKYDIQRIIPDNHGTVDKVYNNKGEGYSMREVGQLFASQLTGNIRTSDIAQKDEGPYRTYKEIAMDARNTARKRFIKEFKEETGVDLRKAVRERSQKSRT